MVALRRERPWSASRAGGDRDLHRLYPARVDRSPSDVEARAGEPDLDVPHTVDVSAERDGYIQTLRSDRLLEIARRNDLVIELEYRPGEWVVRGATLAVVASQAPLDGDLPEEVRRTFVVARHRSVAQDAEFGSGRSPKSLCAPSRRESTIPSRR